MEDQIYSKEEIEKYNHAMECMKEKKYPEAIKAFRDIINDEKSYDLYNNLGCAYLCVNALSSALQAFDTALELAPSEDELLSKLLDENRDISKIEEIMKKNNSITGLRYANRARILKDIGKLEEAVISFNKARELGYKGQDL